MFSLRNSNIDASSGSVTQLARIVRQLCASWSTTRILVRVGSGFCRKETMAWHEANDVDYASDLAGTLHLVGRNGCHICVGRQSGVSRPAGHQDGCRTFAIAP